MEPMGSPCRLPALLLAALLLSLPALQLAAASALHIPLAGASSQQIEQLQPMLDQHGRFHVLSHSQPEAATYVQPQHGEDGSSIAAMVLPTAAWHSTLDAVVGWWQQVPSAVAAVMPPWQQPADVLGSLPEEGEAAEQEQQQEQEHMWMSMGRRSLLEFGRKRGAINAVRNNIKDGPGNSIAKPFRRSDTADPVTAYLCSSVSGNQPPNC